MGSRFTNNLSWIRDFYDKTWAVLACLELHIVLLFEVESSEPMKRKHRARRKNSSSRGPVPTRIYIPTQTVQDDKRHATRLTYETRDWYKIISTSKRLCWNYSG